MVLVEHTLTVPLDHDRPDGATIEVFAREIAASDTSDRPYLLFLQGGPGNEAPRPTRVPAAPAWLARALRDYRVIMLDQRGTGRSTPYGTPGADPAAEAERLRHFRADAIVRDAECLREQLGLRRWSLLGQSFGGFCSLHYLCAAPDSLREVYCHRRPAAGRPAARRCVLGDRSTRCGGSTSATSAAFRRTATGSLDCWTAVTLERFARPMARASAVAYCEPSGISWEWTAEQRPSTI